MGPAVVRLSMLRETSVPSMRLAGGRGGRRASIALVMEGEALVGDVV